MKTIIHLELSDEARNHLAKRIYSDPNTKVLVTRKEVTEFTLAMICDEIKKGSSHDQSTKVDGAAEADSHGPAERREVREGTRELPDDFTPSRGDEDYLAHPESRTIAACCSRILDDTAIIEQFAWDTVERNRKS